ncbi:MAG: polysaccharide biosynthesis protein [bacterium]|nr:polysaccharide biosynthesis protein [bacterium]
MKEKFIKSTLILIIGGAITKVLGMVIKIIMTRLVGLEGIGLYMLIFPTFSLFMSMSQLSLPVSISKLVSEEKYNNKKLVFSSFPIMMITNLILMVIILCCASFFANNLLNEPRVYLPILAISLVLPFEALSNLLRGYFFGKQRMFPHVVSHVIEQIIRLVLIILVIPTLMNKNIIYAVTFLILVNMVSELTSIFILLLFLPKNTTIKKSDLIPSSTNVRNILNISIPTTGSRLIGNVGYFLEPIIITFVLTTIGYSNTYILSEYGIISGYVMPLLLLPSFFTTAISQALIPVISKSYSNQNYSYTKKKLKQGILLSLLIGIPSTMIFILFPEFFLNLIYHTTEGSEYIRFLAPIFLLHYLETPLSSSLQAMGKAKETFLSSLKTTILRTISLFLLLFLNIGMWGFVLSLSISIIYTTYTNFRYIQKSFN